MKVPSSGRHGYGAKTPPPKIEKAIKKVLSEQPVAPLGHRLAVWAEVVGLSDIDFGSMDDDEIRGLTIDLVMSLGAEASLAPRVIAKINGLANNNRQ